MLVLASFFPLPEGGDENHKMDIISEFMKSTMDLSDLLAIHLLMSQTPGKGALKILIAGLGWSSAEFVTTKLIPLWVGFRDVEFRQQHQSRPLPYDCYSHLVVVQNRFAESLCPCGDDAVGPCLLSTCGHGHSLAHFQDICLEPAFAEGSVHWSYWWSFITDVPWSHKDIENILRYFILDLLVSAHGLQTYNIHCSMHSLWSFALRGLWKTYNNCY